MRLDREITFQTSSSAPNAVGQEVKTWSDYVTVDAIKREESGSERVRSGRLDADQAVFWTIRFRDDITAQMRVVSEGDTYNVHGTREIGTEEYLEVTTTKA